MAKGLILETSFLIDLERERRRRTRGPAMRFLAEHEDIPLFVTPVVAGEMAAGSEPDSRPEWEAFLAPFHVLPHTLDACWTYSRIYRDLREQGRLIGGNDLWIAATSLAHDTGLVTANVEHFEHVSGLRVVRYRD